MNTRWVKVWRDLWSQRARTVLVVLSIAIGVFAIGMIASTQEALTQTLVEQYAALRPADIILQTIPGLDDDFITSLGHMRGVAEAEGRRALALRISLDSEGDTWRDLNLYALADYETQQLFRVKPQDGSWPPAKGEVLMERASMGYLGLMPGDQILVKTSDGRKCHLRVAGRAHDLYRIPPVIEGWIYGYVSLDTIRWMGESEKYNEVYVTAQAVTNLDVRALADKVEDRIEGEGLPVFQKTLPDRGQHPLNFIIETVLGLLGLLAGLSMFLSSLLVINIISALLAQQERQIGIMKAIGARTGQVIGLYFGTVLLLGSVACLTAIPFSNLGANLLAGFVAELINFDPPVVSLTVQAVLVQLAVGLLTPLLAAAIPILSGSRVSAARVLSEYGLSQVWRGAGVMDTLLRCCPRLTRDLLLAARNPFRKRGRLVLSLTTLACAGGVFMAIINLQASLNASLSEMLGFWAYDAWLVVDDHVSARRLTHEAQTIPGVEHAEAWGFALGRYVRPDDTESSNLYLLAPPAGTKLLNPPIIAGRALLPGETNAILVTPGLVAREPGVRLGGDITVKIEGRKEQYRVVGVMQMMGNSTIGYFTVMDYAAFARHVRAPNRANAIILTLAPSDLAGQRGVSSNVEKHYDRVGIRVQSNFLIAEEREEIDGAFAIIVALLMVMTLILAQVGGLGLMGAMSLNVIERTREIGVMRAYGASNAAIFRVVIVEGLLIGLLSWGLAIGLSLPVSVVIARSVGLSFMDYPMPATFSPAGVVLWAGLVALIAVVASLMPAMRAVRLTVTEVLAYE